MAAMRAALGLRFARGGQRPDRLWAFLLGAAAVGLLRIPSRGGPTPSSAPQGGSTSPQAGSSGALAVYIDVGSSGMRARLFVLDHAREALRGTHKLGSLAGEVKAPREEVEELGLSWRLSEYLHKSDQELGNYTQIFAKHLREKLCHLCYDSEEGRNWCRQPFHNETWIQGETSPCEGSRVRMYATAGLRQYHHEFGSERVNHFFEVMHHSLVFALPKVFVVDAQIILGTQEAFYAWAEVNLFDGTKSSSHPRLPIPDNAAVAMEMGGASFQAALPLSGPEDLASFHRAEQAARSREAQDFLLSAIDLKSQALPSEAESGWSVYQVATFSLLSIYSRRDRLRCCERDPGSRAPEDVEEIGLTAQDNAFMCKLDGVLLRSPEDCHRSRESRHKVGGRISMLKNLIDATAGPEGQEEHPKISSACLSSDIQIDDETYTRAANANGTACDEEAAKLVGSDEHFNLTARFIREYRGRARAPRRRAVAIGDFALLGEVGLREGRSTLAEVRAWAQQTIDGGSEGSGGLGGSNAAFMLLLYHMLRGLGFDDHENLLDPLAELQLVPSFSAWPGTGLQSKSWETHRLRGGEQGLWEPSWSLGALFMQHFTLGVQ